MVCFSSSSCVGVTDFLIKVTLTIMCSLIKPLFKTYVSSGELPSTKNGTIMFFMEMLLRANMKLMTTNSYITSSYFYASKLTIKKE